jgi:hypothetical protein
LEMAHGFSMISRVAAMMTDTRNKSMLPTSLSPGHFGIGGQ